MGGIEEEIKDTDPAFSDDEELVREITKNLKEGRNHLLEWRDEARECFDYFAGNQWSEEDIQTLQEDNRAPIVFNRTFRTVNGVTGLETDNRQDISFSPMEEDDGGKAELWNAAIKWVRSNCDAEDEESEMFQDTTICGMGWTETRISYEENLNGDIVEDRIDPLQMIYDPNARKQNLADTRWRAREKEYSEREFREIWKDKDPQFGSFWPDNYDGNVHDATDAFLYENDQSDPLKKSKSVSVIQYQWWEWETMYRVVDRENNILGFTDSKFKKIKDFVESEGLRYIKQPRKVYKQAFLNGKQILEMGPAPIDRFSLNCMTGFRDRNTNTWFGIVRPMKDPQMWANKWMSQILHIINSNAKGGLLAEEGAFKSIRDAEDKWSKTNSIITTNPGAITQGKIQTRESPRYPEGLDRMLQLAMQSVSEVTGVNLEMLGVANRDQAASLELSRKEAGVKILGTLFNALRRYRKVQGRVMAAFIKNYIADGRLIRVVGERKKQFIPLLQDGLSLKYDVVVDESPSSPNMQDKVFMVISNLMPTLLQAGIPIPPEVLDYAPLPEALKTKWKETLANPAKQQHENQMKQITMALAQLEAAKKEKEVGETESKTILNMAKAQQAAAIGEDEAAQAANKLGLDTMAHASKDRQLQQDTARKDVAMILDQKRKDKALQLETERKNRERNEGDE